MTKRRRREQRDPLGDKVVNDARREAVQTLLDNIVDRHPASQGRETLDVVLLAQITGFLAGNDVDDAETSDAVKNVKLSSMHARLAMSFADSVRAEDPMALLSWIYDDGTPAGQRCGYCALRLPNASGRGRPRKYCDEHCRRQYMRRARQQEAKAARAEGEPEYQRMHAGLQVGSHKLLEEGERS